MTSFSQKAVKTEVERVLERGGFDTSGGMPRALVQKQEKEAIRQGAVRSIFEGVQKRKTEEEKNFDVDKYRAEHGTSNGLKAISKTIEQVGATEKLDVGNTVRKWAEHCEAYQRAKVRNYIKPAELEKSRAAVNRFDNYRSYIQGGELFSEMTDPRDVKDKVHVRATYAVFPDDMKSNQVRGSEYVVTTSESIKIRELRGSTRRRRPCRYAKMTHKEPSFKGSFNKFLQGQDPHKNMQDACALNRARNDETHVYEEMMRTMSLCKSGTPMRRLVNLHILAAQLSHDGETQFDKPPDVNVEFKNNDYRAYSDICEMINDDKSINIINGRDMEEKDIFILMLSTLGYPLTHNGKTDMYIGGYKIEPEVEGPHVIYVMTNGSKSNTTQLPGRMKITTKDVLSTIGKYVTGMSIQDQEETARMLASVLITADGVPNFTLPVSNGYLDFIAVAINKDNPGDSSIPRLDDKCNLDFESAIRVRSAMICLCQEVFTLMDASGSKTAAYLSQSTDIREGYYRHLSEKVGAFMNIVALIDPLNVEDVKVGSVLKQAYSRNAWSTELKLALDRGVSKTFCEGRLCSLQELVNPKSQAQRDVYKFLLNFITHEDTLMGKEGFCEDDLIKISKTETLMDMIDKLPHGAVRVALLQVGYGIDEDALPTSRAYARPYSKKRLVQVKLHSYTAKQPVNIPLTMRLKKRLIRNAEDDYVDTEDEVEITEEVIEVTDSIPETAPTTKTVLAASQFNVVEKDPSPVKPPQPPLPPSAPKPVKKANAQEKLSPVIETRKTVAQVLSEAPSPTAAASNSDSAPLARTTVPKRTQSAVGRKDTKTKANKKRSVSESSQKERRVKPLAPPSKVANGDKEAPFERYQSTFSMNSKATVVRMVDDFLMNNYVITMEDNSKDADERWLHVMRDFKNNASYEFIMTLYFAVLDEKHHAEKTVNQRLFLRLRHFFDLRELGDAANVYTKMCESFTKPTPGQIDAISRLNAAVRPHMSNGKPGHIVDLVRAAVPPCKDGFKCLWRKANGLGDVKKLSISALFWQCLFQNGASTLCVWSRNYAPYAIDDKVEILAMLTHYGVVPKRPNVWASVDRIKGYERSVLLDMVKDMKVENTYKPEDYNVERFHSRNSKLMVRMLVPDYQVSSFVHYTTEVSSFNKQFRAAYPGVHYLPLPSRDEIEEMIEKITAMPIPEARSAKK